MSVEGNPSVYPSGLITSDLTVTGDLVVQGGLVATVASGGEITVEDGGEISFGDGSTLTIASGGEIVVEGEMTLSDGGLLLVTATGTLTVEAEGSWDIEGDLTIAEGGTLTIASGAGQEIAGTLGVVDGGKIDVESGGSIDVAGTMNIVAGGALNIDAGATIEYDSTAVYMPVTVMLSVDTDDLNTDPLEVIAGVDGYQIRTADWKLVARGGAATGATSLDLEDNSDTPVSVAVVAVAGLTEDNVVGPGTATHVTNGVGSCGGLLGAGKGLFLVVVGDDLATATSVDVIVTYTLVAAA